MIYRFTVVLEGIETMTEEVADRLFAAGCDDATPFSRSQEAAVGFDREADSLEAAMRSALHDVRAAGLEVRRVEIDPADVTLAATA